MRTATRTLMLGMLMLACSPALAATTWHVRVDGGLASQCTGKVDTAYPGAGTGLSCAWRGPMVALPPGGPARIAGGDTLIIHNGQHMIGYGAPGADSCSTNWSYDCTLLPVPSGPDAATPTRIVGEGYLTGCKVKPQLWGTERALQVLSLKGTRNAEVSCLEITDHADCVYAHSGGLACKRTGYPYGMYADNGIFATDSINVKLSKVDVHGLANTGILAGRLTDWTLTDVRIAANGWAGWNGDVSSDGTGKGSSNAGTMRFTRWVVEYNGCSETWPGKLPAGCWGQEAGGYGDGVGTGSTGGDWIIEDSRFRFNVSDGLDLLYHDKGGTITINRVRARGNAGQQIKAKGNVSVSNSFIDANCGYFSGKAFAYKVDNCRALGDALSLFAATGTDILTATNNTIVSQGNVNVLASGPPGSVLIMRNNVQVGLPFYLDPSVQSADTYIDGPIRLDEAYGVKQTLRNVKCTAPNTICGDAGLVSATLGRTVNPRLQPTSKAVNSGVGVGSVGTLDVYRTPRVKGAGIDRGAVEQQ